MPAQTLVFSEQFTSACVFRTRTIGLLECFTLSLGWQWSALSTLFPGLDFLTALSLSLSFHPSESSSLPLPLLGSLSEAHSHSLVTSLSLSLARSLTLTPPPPLSFICYGFSLARSLFLSRSLSLSGVRLFLSLSLLPFGPDSLERVRARGSISLVCLFCGFDFLTVSHIPSLLSPPS
jgi:hypothetical protein